MAGKAAFWRNSVNQGFRAQEMVGPLLIGVWGGRRDLDDFILLRITLAVEPPRSDVNGTKDPNDLFTIGWIPLSFHLRPASALLFTPPTIISTTKQTIR
jgi:hypothetical protein